MKKIVILLICLLAASSLFAADITLGGALGFSNSWLSGSDWDNMLKDYDASNEFRLGFEIGGFVDIAINKMFSIQPELNFFYMRAGAGGSYDNSGIKIDDDLTLAIKILEIPVLAKFNFPAGKGKFSVFLGPAVQFVLGDAKLTAEESAFGYSASVDIPVEVDNSVIFAGVFGAGYAIPMGPGSLAFDLRYRRQFTGFDDDVNFRGNTIGIRVGYGIGLKK